MMSSLTPNAVRIIDQYDDGLDARHYTFEPLAASDAHLAQAGQFFMLSVPGFGEAPFTYVSPPDARGRFHGLVRRVGSLTTALFQLPTGAIVGARGPLGCGWPSVALHGQRVLVIAGGCGLAPLSPALDALSRGGDVYTRAVLVYGSRTRESQVLGRERAQWRGKLTSFEVFDHPSAENERAGTPLSCLDEALTALGGAPDYALVCGPEAMMLATAKAVHDKGVPRERIFVSLERRMHCGVGVCGHCYVAQMYVCKQGPTYRFDELLVLQAKSPAREPALAAIHHC